MRNDIYLKNVVTLALAKDKCTGCGMCAVVCPHGVFAISEQKSAIIQRDACMECGACAQNCPFRAISVRSGVGCASGILNGVLRNSEASCGCDSQSTSCR